MTGKCQTEVAFSLLRKCVFHNSNVWEEEGASPAVNHTLYGASRSYMKPEIPLSHSVIDTALMLCVHVEESLGSPSLPLCAGRGLDWVV